MKDAKGHGSGGKGGMKAAANSFESAFRSAQSPPKKKKSKVTASSFEKALRSAQKGK